MREVFNWLNCLNRCSDGSKSVQTRMDFIENFVKLFVQLRCNSDRQLKGPAQLLTFSKVSQMK